MGGTWYAGDGESGGAGCAAAGATGLCWYIGAFMVPGVMWVGVIGADGAVGSLLYISDAVDDLPCVNLGGRRSIKKKSTINSTHFTLSNTTVTTH